MRLVIAAVGRMKTGPEAQLCADYLARAGQAGRGIGLYPIEERSVEARQAGDKAQEAALLGGVIAPGAKRVLLDERGENWPSLLLAQKLAGWRDGGWPAAVFLIGGPDGHGDRLRDEPHDLFALGAQTWPHRLVRVMLAEQLYRAVTILCGSPYHRQ